MFCVALYLAVHIEPSFLFANKESISLIQQIIARFAHQHPESWSWSGCSSEADRKTLKIHMNCKTTLRLLSCRGVCGWCGWENLEERTTAGWMEDWSAHRPQLLLLLLAVRSCNFSFLACKMWVIKSHACIFQPADLRPGSSLVVLCWCTREESSSSSPDAISCVSWIAKSISHRTDDASSGAPDTLQDKKCNRRIR